MPRPKRITVKFTEDGVNELYQEIYNDSHNYKAQITAILARWTPFVKDEGNIAAMGKEIVALMNQLAKTNDQKIVLLKILKEIVFDKKGAAGDTKPNASDAQVHLTDDTKRELLRLAEEARRGIEESD
jgi:hypothetical protein